MPPATDRAGVGAASYLVVPGDEARPFLAYKGGAAAGLEPAMVLGCLPIPC